MKKQILFFAAISSLCLISIISNAQTPSWLWAKSAGGTRDDYPLSVAVDASGNTYIAGAFESDTIIFGSIILTNTTNHTAIFLAKYDANGNVLWAKSASGTYGNSKQANSVVVDALGNVYVAGWFYGTTITFGSITLTNVNNAGGQNMFLVKYDTNGNVIWAKSASGTDSDGAGSVVVSASGNIYVTGWFYGSNNNINPTIITFDSITFTNANTSDFGDVFITKYDANGNVLWAKSASGTRNSDAYSVTVDASENIYLTGLFGGPTLTFGTTILANTDNSGNTNNLFLAKYDAAGNMLWAKSVGGTFPDEGGYSIKVDASSNIYLTGSFDGSTLTFGTTILTNPGGADIFLAKYDTNANVLWAKSAGGNDVDYTYSIALDASGNIYVVGCFVSYSITFGTITLMNVDNTENSADMFIAKYNANGNVIWAKSAGGIGSEAATSVVVNAIGNVYVAGYFSSPSLSLGSTTLINSVNSGNSVDIFLAKLGNGNGINELSNSLNISIYPNPAINNLSIEIPQQAIIEISNIQGQLIKTLAASGNKTNVDISGFANGMYFIKVKTEKEVWVRKFVKE